MRDVFAKIMESDDNKALEDEKTKIVTRLIKQLKQGNNEDISIICSERSMTKIRAWCSEVGLVTETPTIDKTYAVVKLS